MHGLPIWAIALLFAAGSAAIWWAGVRLEHTADALARRTGMGQALAGALLLATATSLPEVATTVTALVFLDDPTLAVYNLLGGVAFQTVILTAADLAQRDRGALTFFSPSIELLVQGIALVLLLQLAVAGLATRGEPVLLSVSVWVVLVAATHVAALWLTRRRKGGPGWRPARTEGLPERAPEGEDAPGGDGSGRSTAALWWGFAGLSAIVLAGGWLAASTADVLAEETGLGAAFLGATLLAAATSLPELSTTLSAARAGHYPLAVSNVFGSNSFDVSLLLLADLLYRDGSILAKVEGPVVFVAALGAALTCLYLWGLAERRDRTLLRLGWDSALVLALYGGGMAVLYFSR